MPEIPFDQLPATGSRQAPEPLAARMRPRHAEDLTGQEHLLTPGAPLHALLAGKAMSAVLWGPPGSGKTTLSALIAARSPRSLIALSALDATVKDLRDIIAHAHTHPTLVQIDEAHRLTRNQADALLAATEDGTLTFIAATTENPAVALPPAILSRSVQLELRPLTDAHIATLIERAAAAPQGLAGQVTVDPDAATLLARHAGGDARRALTTLEAAAAAAQAADRTTIDKDLAAAAAGTQAPAYDKNGSSHYDAASALQKSIRGSNPDAALHYLARMIAGGEDPRYIARRLIVCASEDIGLADPTALPTAIAAAQAVQLVGMPEARFALAHATVHLACAPKSAAAHQSLAAALADVTSGKSGPVPEHLRDAHHRGAPDRGYRNPHDDPRGIVTQQYLPDKLLGRVYYQPTRRGRERTLADQLRRIREILIGA